MIFLAYPFSLCIALITMDCLLNSTSLSWSFGLPFWTLHCCHNIGLSIEPISLSWSFGLPFWTLHCSHNIGLSIVLCINFMILSHSFELCNTLVILRCPLNFVPLWWFCFELWITFIIFAHLSNFHDHSSPFEPWITLMIFSSLSWLYYLDIVLNKLLWL